MKPFKIDFDIKKLELIPHIPHHMVCVFCSKYLWGVSVREFKANPQKWYNSLGGKYR